MTFGTWVGNLLALVFVSAFDIVIAYAGLHWLNLSEFWVLVILISVNTNIIIARQ